ncbi:MAG: hypothetical protein D6711_11025, partial [Chloroflexi bacterium]
LVLCLREIADGIEESTVAWEKRDYWIKAEEFRRRWNWTHEIASELEALIRTEQWDDIAPIMLKLIPYFKDIKVTRFTRNASIWQHAYDQLINEGN